MKNENIERTFCAHNAAVHERALKEYRRRGFRRRIANGSVAVVIIGALLTFAFQKSNDNDKVIAGSERGASTVQVSNSAVSPEIQFAGIVRGRGNTTGELNDEQLLAIFPEGSCFIAEVNGKKMLVFRDAQLRARFLN
jgi:hypothetical protein